MESAVRYEICHLESAVGVDVSMIMQVVERKMNTLKSSL